MSLNETSSRPLIDEIIANAIACLPPQYADAPWAHPELKRGAGLLQSEEALDCYMAAYGEAHKRKALQAFSLFPFDKLRANFEIYDWGCGQGIASVCLLQALEEKSLLARVQCVNLIEPSAAALARSASHVKRFDKLLKIRRY